MAIWKKLGVAMLLGCAAMAVSAQEPSPAPSAQQLFNAAEEASVAGDHAKALSLLTQIAERVKNPRTLAIVRLRQGIALSELSRWDEARPLLEQALANLPEGDRSLDADRGEAMRRLGRLEMADLDYETARSYYQKASMLAPDPRVRISDMLTAIQAGTFIDPMQALTQVAEVERLVAALPAGDKEKATGFMMAVKGGVLLNLRRFAEAESAFAQTVKAEGGLGLKVDYSDLVARSDASIAAMLAGHRNVARHYLLYTGAGRTKKQDFIAGADMALPVCGDEDVRPDDVAVVEFGIGDNGAVSYARPIYGSREGGMALVFARAVRDWSWLPEDVVQIPALFRFVTRLELRCSSSQGGPSLEGAVRASFFDWIHNEGVNILDREGEGQVQRRTALEAELTRLRATPSEPALAQAAVLSQLLDNSTVTGAQARSYGVALRAIMDMASPSPMARLWADWQAQRGNRHREVKPQDYAAAPQAYVAAQLLTYDRMSPQGKVRNRHMLDDIIVRSDLPAAHPMRVAALVRRAGLRVAAKDLAGAQADYRATGMTEQQCSIVDARPALKSAPTSPTDYPTDMVQVGIEGWTRVQFDISSDGKTMNQRAVVAYPPMTFGDNGVRIMSRARFEQSYRPEGGMGCGGSFSTVNFRNP